ncbi:hypothetical protein [Luteibacter yeojuensis]|uniref:Uncharacterized protein n=1 Tax=Luteibacter yeojuensis TaxID=345309 RepID=A0A7X5TQA5_9GAMM|nr:hypothetical protein [Luteibacter yeojuensis]NID15618.1 hypothetical protein [Luteibacter yeojuensis]
MMGVTGKNGNRPSRLHEIIRISRVTACIGAVTTDAVRKPKKSVETRIAAGLVADATEGTQFAPSMEPGALAGPPVIEKKQGFRVAHRRLSHA